MKLYIKQRVFSWTDKFSVKDEYGNNRYFVQGELFSWGKKLHVSDAFDREVVFIQQKVWSWNPRYFVYINGVQVAEIVREFTFFKPRYSVLGLGWDIDGEFFSHDYTAVKNGRPIVSISKEWFTWGDSYVLDIADPRDELPALAVVLAIDCAMESQNSSSSN